MGSAPVIGSTAGLIDETIGTAYNKVRTVAENIEFVKHVSDNLPKVHRVDASIDLVEEALSELPVLLDLQANIGPILEVAENVAPLTSVGNNVDALLNLNTNTPSLITAAETTVTKAAEAAASADLAAGYAEGLEDFADVLQTQLPQKALMTLPWRGGLETFDAAAWRQLEVPDLRFLESGTFGDMLLTRMVRMNGSPIEAESFNSVYLDAVLALDKLITDQDPRVILLTKPPYYFRSPLSYPKVKRRTFRSHSAGAGAPPTIVMENPLHTAFSFAAGTDDVRFEGCLKIHHRIKPASTGVPTVQFAGGNNIYIEELVITNANLALRVTGGTNLRIGHLVTDADVAINASAGGLVIDRHTKIGAGANTVTGGENLSIGKPSAGLWTPTADFDTHGDLTVSYGSTAAFYERIGKQVFVHGSITFTPTYTTAAGAFRLGGLPFLAKAGSESGFIGITSMSAMTWPTISSVVASQAGLSVAPGTDYMRLFGQRSGGGTGNFATTHVPTATPVTLRFSGSYEAQV